MRTLFVLLFVCSLSFGQKNYYFDRAGKSISEGSFKKKSHDYKDYTISELKTDTATIFRLEPRWAKGILSQNEYVEIISNLSSNSQDSLTKKTIVIDYYPGLDDYNRLSDWPNKPNWDPYLAELQKFSSLKHFFVHTPDENVRTPLRENVVADNDKIIEKAFFPAHYPWGSFAIIWPDRTYVVYKGEYPKDYVLKSLKDK